jgi:hypothetical protein
VNVSKETALGYIWNVQARGRWVLGDSERTVLERVADNHWVTCLSKLKGDGGGPSNKAEFLRKEEWIARQLWVKTKSGGYVIVVDPASHESRPPTLGTATLRRGGWIKIKDVDDLRGGHRTKHRCVRPASERASERSPMI